MKNKIIWKFLSAYTLLILVAVIVLNFFVSLRLKDYYESKISERLSSNAFLIGRIIENDIFTKKTDLIQEKTIELSKKLGFRITIIDPQGHVLGDSEKTPQVMDDHKNRLEVIRAMGKGVGESNRFSDTLGYNMKYVAVTVKDNDTVLGLIRVALPLTDVESQIRVIYRVVLVGGIAAILAVLIIGFFISRSIVMPIREMEAISQSITQGNFSKRIKIYSQDELGMLAKSLNKMANELESKIDNLKRMNKIRTDFVANVSHELKTPLTSIKGFIETLEDGAIEDIDNARRFIKIIKKRTQGLGNMIDDLLSLSELESKPIGAEILDKKEFNLKNSIEEVILGFGHALKLKDQELKIDYAEINDNDFIIKADRMKLEQIFVNLIDNAIKYSQEKSQINFYVNKDKKNFIIKIKDTGVGIPQKDIPRVFERFYRVDKARSQDLGGTGLGLAIVKHIVLLHKGNIEIESEIDQGTEVTIILPVA